MQTINRNTELRKIKEFALNGNGLIVGKPGIGKTHLLNQLTDLLLAEQVVTILVPINDLFDGSDEAINTALALGDYNWLNILSQIDVADGVKGILIFDSFDAARNEKFRNEILGQIKKAKAKLSVKWNIIVSVRTYDATKSEELIRLFPQGDITHAISCRKHVIENLNEEEISQLKDGNPALYEFYQHSGKPLKEILRIPFFLYLADAVIANSNATETLSFADFESETQLLNVYWNIKILRSTDYEIREKLLAELSSSLVTDTKLNIPKYDLAEMASIGGSQAFEYLSSENILTQVQTTGNRVTYSHNIFFDYAVSRYTIPTDLPEFIEFILVDKSRPFFLRPSYIYFFSQLWYEQRQKFWSLYFDLIDRKESVIKLFHRIVLSSVIVIAFRIAEELAPLFAPSHRETYTRTIKNILQSLRFIRERTGERDAKLLIKLIEDLPIDCIPDYIFILNKLIEDFKASGKDLSQLGELSRTLLSRALGGRTSTDAITYNWMAPFAVEFVCKTYGTSPIESEEILKKLFDLLKENNFEIRIFSTLCEHIKEIISLDTEFVCRVYIQIFTHVENSQERTTLGPGSVVMNFTSTRQQDFELCQYRLVELFPEVLSASPHLAIETGLNVANMLILWGHDLRKEYDNTITFNLHGKACKFTADHSFLRIGNHDQDYPNRLIADIFNYLSQKMDNPENIKGLLNTVILSSGMGYTWATLINFGIINIKKLHGFFYEFCLTEVLLASPDTLFEMTNLVRSITPLISLSQVNQMEDFISSSAQALKAEKIQPYLLRYLSAIGDSHLNREDSKQLLKELGAVENVPLATFTSESGEYTTTEYLKNWGVDLNDPVNKSFNIAISKLEVFNRNWQNKTPDRKAYAKTLTFCVNNYKTLKKYKKIPTPIVSSLLREIASALRKIVADYINLTEAEYRDIKEISFACLNYLTPSELDGSFKGSPQSGYGSTPRIEAAAILSYLYQREPDKETEGFYRMALNSENIIVRFHAIYNFENIAEKAPAFYKEIVIARTDEETDGFVCSIIISTIISGLFTTEEFNKILTTFLNKPLLDKNNNTFLETYSLWLIRLAYFQENTIAQRILRTAVSNQFFCNIIIFQLFKEFSACLPNITIEKCSTFIDHAVKLILKYISAINTIIRVNITVKGLDGASLSDQYTIINQIILRLFFVFDRPGNIKRKLDEKELKNLYSRVKPIIVAILDPANIPSNSVSLPGVSAHNMIQILNLVLSEEPRQVLKMVKDTIKYSLRSGYSFDYNSMQQIIQLTEKMLADHRDVLQEEESFAVLIELLEFFVESNWVAALQLLWRLDEVFK